jgi:predicted nuclease of predicted toxin-antitoxin system
MSVFFINDRKYRALIIALICAILMLVFPMTTVSAAESNSYDFNSNGIIDEDDVAALTDAIISSDNSDYHVCDLVRITKTSQTTPEIMNFVVSEMDVSDSNNMVHINLLLSDFNLVVRENDKSLHFEFYEEGLSYFDVEWTKDDNIVYNRAIASDDCIVSYDSDRLYQVFIYDNKYMLNIVPHLAPPLAMIDFTEDSVSDSQIQQLKELFCEWNLVSATNSYDYVNFYFTSKDSSGDYVARIPVCKDTEIKDTINIISNITVDGINYTIFTNVGSNSVQFTA